MGKKASPALSIDDEGILEMRVHLGDIDPYLELNNGRHLTMMDFGRFDLAKRSGLYRLVRENGWGFTVAGASVRYRHRLKLFQKYTLHSQVAGFDEKWIYFHQKTVSNGKVHSAALVRTAVTSRNGIVPTLEVLAAMNYKDLSYRMPEWIKAWTTSDEMRPWD